MDKRKLIVGEGCIPMMRIEFVTKDRNMTRDVVG